MEKKLKIIKKYNPKTLNNSMEKKKKYILKKKLSNNYLYTMNHLFISYWLLKLLKISLKIQGKFLFN